MLKIVTTQNTTWKNLARMVIGSSPSCLNVPGQSLSRFTMMGVRLLSLYKVQVQSSFWL
jgi:hypothetical protein